MGPLIPEERGKYHLSTGVNVVYCNSSQWATAPGAGVGQDTQFCQLLNLQAVQAGLLHREKGLISFHKARGRVCL